VVPAVQGVLSARPGAHQGKEPLLRPRGPASTRAQQQYRVTQELKQHWVSKIPVPAERCCP